MKNLFKLAVFSLLITSCSTTPNNQEKRAAATPSVSSPKNPDMTEFAAEVDADKNGQMSKAEWTAKGLPESSFNGFEKGRGFVTLADYTKNAAPPGIDGNGDGKLTVAEFVAFDKIMSEKMKSREMPPPK